MTPRIRYEIATWNAAQRAAQTAYRADRLVEDGWCPCCGYRAVDGTRRQCRACRRAGRREK